MTIIGREPPADVVFPVAQVSARHAEIIHVVDDVYLLSDLGSTNGTFVNGQRVQQAQVRLSDDIRFGSFRANLLPYQGIIPLASSSRSAVIGTAGLPVLPPTPWGPVPASPLWAPCPTVPPPGHGVPAQGAGQQNLQADLTVALAAQKSFTGRAFFVWFLYWLFWLPGFIMNIVYMNEAGRVKKLTGRSASGSGCLAILFFVHVVIPLAALVLIVLTGGAILGSLGRVLR